MGRSLVVAAQAIVWTLLMTWFGRWAESSRARANVDAEPNTLCQPKFVLVVGIVGIATLPALGIACAATSPTVAGALAGGLFAVAFAALSAACILDYARVMHRVDAEGISYAKLLGPGGRAKWSEVKRVSYNDSCRWFTLKTTNRKTIRVSSSLTNFTRFARYVVEGAASAHFTEEAKTLLMRALSGNAPSLWR